MKTTSVQGGTAARGTIALVLSRGCYFFMGYLAVVLLARELGPVPYGVYGVVMALLVWLEESGRHAVPSATAKLLAESTANHDELERSAIALNLGLHTFFFLVLWLLAPLLASWFQVAQGAVLFRLAAIDLPLFGLYTACQAIHQGQRRFLRLGLSQVAYAVAKVVGVLCLVYVGISLEKALVINVVSTIVGLAFLLPGIGLRWRGRWWAHAVPIATVAVPIGLYYFPLMLRSSIMLGSLKMILPAADQSMIGIVVAALNIARVPGFALATVMVVLLPSVSKALARQDMALAKRYISQALRFFWILFLPICFCLMADAEKLMQWVYSRDFAGGGILLSILVVSEGFFALQGILASTLHGAGEMRKTAIVVILTLIPTSALLIVSTHFFGVVGASLAAIVTPLSGICVFAVMLRRRFGPLMPAHSLRHIVLAGFFMFAVDFCLPDVSGWLVLLHGIGLVLYGLILVLSGEVTWRDVSLLLPVKSMPRQAAT